MQLSKEKKKGLSEGEALVNMKEISSRVTSQRQESSFAKSDAIN